MHRLTRREFLAASAVGGAGLIVGCGAPFPDLVLRDPGPARRRIWVFADSHIGLAGRGNDGRDGADWARLSIADAREDLDPIDYVLALGDVTHHAGAKAELRTYVDIRKASGLGPWYELAGNHDYAALPAGRWRRYVRRPARYCLLDGTAAVFFISAEQGKSDGRVSPAAARWLQAGIEHYQDTHNIIVCTHQAVWHTVAGASDSSCCLNHRVLISRILKRTRVDLWLCGHIHGGRRNPAFVTKKDRTVFVNVAALGHAYGTGACHSYVLDMERGSGALIARCRVHDRNTWAFDQEVRMEAPHAWRFADRPTVVPARLRSFAKAS